ncbi:putative surface protein with fasciclin (FAS1) repeats [Sphingomonas jinjuensis]|uniref:Putative surface protein with fasciclin (FAS1) repeats n=1 Tax=Sphingomonas jinjuensis TaxID=535907 RepID=A0A840FBI1_9SPHN|nr:fasciclin domain-containing protein [Sphingomonas jinjuensis]MBB4154002.1 putative surface protein with fasciclin (FAS1) repeats [Sphingomonas jinjuensis]
MSARPMRQRWLIVAGAALALAGCNRQEPAPGNTAADMASSGESLTRALGEDSRFRATAKLVTAAGLDRTFEGKGVYTIFAPTDAAIAALPEDQRRQLESKAGRPQLVALIRQHVVPGYIEVGDIAGGIKAADGTVTLATVGAAPITLHRTGDVVRLGDATSGPRLIGRPVAARNGVVYAIDGVLPPPRVTSASR